MMDAARFATGVTFDDFVGSVQKYPELWSIGARHAAVPADVIERFSAITTPLRLVALHADWCLDAIGVVPHLAKLAELNPLVELRNFVRDENLHLMNSHLTNGTQSIPVIIAYNSDWTERGWWGPLPSELWNWYMETGRNIPKPEKYLYKRQWFARDHGVSSMREITDMVFGTRAPRTPVVLATATG
jgi:hypothetical protein